MQERAALDLVNIAPNCVTAVRTAGFTGWLPHHDFFLISKSHTLLSSELHNIYNFEPIETCHYHYHYQNTLLKTSTENSTPKDRWNNRYAAFGTATNCS